MVILGALVFLAPAILAALILLPVIYWLLRVTPPAPRRLSFPAIRLLLGLDAQEETPERMPWWLLVMRLALAALIIVALAHPVLNPAAALPGNGPVLLVVDNGWAAGKAWPQRQDALRAAVDKAERAGRELLLLPTAPTAPGEPVAVSRLLRPGEARGVIDGLAPSPWPTDRAAALKAVDALRLSGGTHVVWAGDGITTEKDAAGVRDFAARLQRFGGLEVLTPPAFDLAHLVGTPEVVDTALTVPVRRATAVGDVPLVLRATAEDGRPLARTELRFAAGQRQAEARFDLPSAARNAIASVSIESEATAGATVLVDERWRRRPVGLATPQDTARAQPLLTESYYLDRALEPFAEIRRGSVAELLGGTQPTDRLAALLLPDGALSSDADREAADRWMEGGGALIRFAGPILAANPDALVPVPLRFGDRTLSGAMSWTEPMPLAPFDAASPFQGLTIPSDIRIQRQVLADPSPDLADKTWARLTDGTPIVTAERRGRGWLVLIHTTAGPGWSNLPFSGLFVDMLRRVVALGSGVGGDSGQASLPPVRVLDGYGRLIPPPPLALPIAGPAFATTVPGPEHPPGFYGTEDNRRALNLGAAVTSLEPFPDLPAGVTVSSYQAPVEVDLRPWIFGAAMALLIIDGIIALVMRGLLTPPRRTTVASVLVAGLAAASLLGPAPARAQDDARIIAMANHVRLAYVETGQQDVDSVSQAGLEGLAQVLRDRTSVNAEGAVGVNVESDELAFFPLLYWPVTTAQPALSDAAIARLNAFLRTGGTIFFDTRDQAVGGGGALAGPGAQKLRELTRGLDIPPLTPVPPDHILTRAFYLMQDFPGRYAGGDLWVETGDATVNDGVSTIIIGANDWAGAWAIDAGGTPMLPVVPGGERQREMAFRFGVNLVMYALTGNYKSDQVHVPAILERLGQ
ncbi:MULTISPECIES: DUF4159 domain-containing protein [Inquilinus]|uniref:DUF4159 domain-containing protein n=1 Tax=Inquilinus ginsengisoli TaxID=363840 RepID=A0ABU1JU65_9PROT|nr:DUF4159 domain-containing protein [Inquilinus ginsengisoli]MDR6291848.1 hypothetical protein [Inquilinus ginsengisoli]